MAEEVANKVVYAIADAIHFLEGVETSYDKHKDTKDLPDAFHNVRKRVKLTKNALKCIESCINNRGYDEKSSQEVRSDVESCKQKAKNLQTLFREVVPPGRIPRLDRYRKVVRDLGGVGNNRVETLMVGLVGDVQSLVPKCTIQQNENATEAVGKEAMEELAAAFEELSAMTPSLSEDSFGNSFNNWSTGIQNVHTGKGTQNNNTGYGMQYVGHTQTFGR